MAFDLSVQIMVSGRGHVGAWPIDSDLPQISDGGLALAPSEKVFHLPNKDGKVMPLVVPNSVLLGFVGQLVDSSVNAVQMRDVIVHLFTNDYTPTTSTTYADLVECVLPGYASVPVGDGDWSAPGLVGGRAQVQLHPPGTIDFTTTDVSGTLIYGYYVTDDPVTRLFFAERFDFPRTLQLASPLALQIYFTLKNEFT